MWSKKVKIKALQNGWLVRYDNWKWEIIREGEMEGVGGYEVEKAFIYDFDDEKDKAWNDLLKFISERYEQEQNK